MSETRKPRSEDLSTVLNQRDLPPQTVPVFSLTVMEGPDKGATVTLDGTGPSRVYLGKSPVCHLKLTDPKVSRRHLAVDVVNHRVRVTDLDSKNGTTVSGLAITQALLRGGEFIRMGDTQVRVDALTPTAVTVSTVTNFGLVVGSSPEMRRIYPLCERLAASDVPLVIEGETGTGKEALAESLHEASARAGEPFIVFDCTAVPPNLMEAALFGHERGAFTGAVSTQKGVFEQAHGGTLLIDEIGDLELPLQAKLLRAIERSEVRRVGGDRWVKVNVRVMAATRRDLDKEIQAGRFRDDLFYRLAVARIELPPLRERHGDVTLLANHFWKHLGGGQSAIPHDLLLRFEDYTWPGNVRELRNSIARRLALGDLAQDPFLRPSAAQALESSGPSSSAPKSSGSPPSSGGPDIIERVIAMNLPLSASRDMVVEDFERRYIDHALARAGGNATAAATASGIARRYFQLLRTRHGVKST